VEFEPVDGCTLVDDVESGDTVGKTPDVTVVFSDDGDFDVVGDVLDSETDVSLAVCVIGG